MKCVAFGFALMFWLSVSTYVAPVWAESNTIGAQKTQLLNNEGINLNERLQLNREKAAEGKMARSRLKAEFGYSETEIKRLEADEAGGNLASIELLNDEILTRADRERNETQKNTDVSTEMPDLDALATEGDNVPLSIPDPFEDYDDAREEDAFGDAMSQCEHLSGDDMSDCVDAANEDTQGR